MKLVFHARLVNILILVKDKHRNINALNAHPVNIQFQEEGKHLHTFVYLAKKDIIVVEEYIV